MRRALLSRTLWRALGAAEAPALSQALVAVAVSASAATTAPLLTRTCGLSTSASSFAASGHDDVAKVDEYTTEDLGEPTRRFRKLADKELWHEAWMYEDKFGTPDDPIIVPSLEPERIIGCTDPEDDNLVVWGILRVEEPPRQFIEHGEFYKLIVVPYVRKVGDVLDSIASGTTQDTIGDVVKGTSDQKH